MRLKVSYSLINLWQRGDYQGVWDALHGKWKPATPQMEFGTKMHKEWEEEVKRTQHLPKIFGGNELVKPITEKYHLVQVYDWLWLSGIIDLQYGENGETIVDYKTGRGNANSYMNSLQVGCYKILQPKAKQFRFLCWNQYDDKVTTSQIWLTDKLMEEAINQVFTVGCDIRAMLEAQGVGDDFDNINKTRF